jgi:hypothetical protein
MLTEADLVKVSGTSDFKDLMSRIKRAEEYTEKWHQNIRRWRKLYNLDHYQRTGKTSEVLYSDPTYTNTVDLSVGIMLGNDLRWHAYGMAPSAGEQKATGKLEKLIAGTLEINGEREEEHLPYKLFLNFNRDAAGVIYSVYDPALTEDKEVMEVPNGTDGVVKKWKFAEVPIRTKIIDPLQTIFLPGGPKKWLLIGRKESRSILDVETTYGVKFEKYATWSQEMKSSTMGIFYDIWDYAWITEGQQNSTEVTDTLPDVAQRKLIVRNTRIFDGRPVVGPKVMTGYVDLPYTVQFFKPVGDESGDWHNIMTPLETSVNMLERSFNRRAKQIDIYTAMPLIVKTQPGRKVVVDPGLYNSVTITPDESIEFPRWPGNAPDVQEHMDMLRSRIQQSGFSDVMFGSGSSQIAGYALSQLGDQNRIRLQQPIQHLELLLTSWAKKTMRMLQTFAPGTIMCVYGHQKGEDYMDYVDMDELKGFSIRAEIRPNFPNEEMRRVAMSTQVKGTISDYTRREKYLGIEQPEDEEKRMLIEAAQRHPVAQMYALMSVLNEAAQAGDEVAAMTLQTIQQQGIPGQAGRPGEPNKPEQLTGTASPTGQEPALAAGPNGSSAMAQQESMSNAAPNLSGGM